MRRCLVLPFALCAVFGLFATPASAAPPPAQITALCVVAAGDQPCAIQFGPGVGTGQDMHISMGNRCDGPTVCDIGLFFQGGTFGNVVVTVANQCTNGATCTIAVDGFGASFKSFKIRRGVVFGTYNLEGINIQNRCDASSACTVAPTQAGPYTPITGGLCSENQQASSPCFIGGTVEGTGSDLHVLLGNQCSGPVSCTQDWTLAGTFNRVVIDRANQCSNHATCTITVQVEAQIKESLTMRSRTFSWDSETVVTNRCDATAVCTITP
jgi:hypothetical protein